MDTRESIVIVGRSGQLSWELQRSLTILGNIKTVGRPDTDLSDPEAVTTVIKKLKPTILVNAAGYTSVDQAEVEPDLATKVNASAPAVMAELAKRIGSLFVHYSTDFVFDGSSESPYREEDQPAPLNAYGISKAAGDRAIAEVGGNYLIFRVSWVYGARGKNFLRTLTRLATERPILRVVDDQIGSPTWSRDIANATTYILGRIQNKQVSISDCSGIYNMTATGTVSWHGFAKAILEDLVRFELLRHDPPKLEAILSKDYPTPATRPKNSRLSNNKLNAVFGIQLPDWRQSLGLVVEELAERQSSVSSAALKAISSSK